MYTFIHTLRARCIREAGQVLLPSNIEQTASRIFESFSDRIKAMLNGRQERALKLALGGNVTHKSARIYSVHSEDQSHAYLVDLERGTCTCPDCQKGNVCKHRLASYLIEQAELAEMSAASEPLDPIDEKIEIVRKVLNARSESLREAIIYARILQDGILIPVEVISLEGQSSSVRALPRLDGDNLVPCFPFSEGQSSATIVLARSLSDITIYR